MPNVKATKVLQKRCEAALEGFHKCYATIYGEQRWHQSLYPALSEATRHCALMNLFGQLGIVEAQLQTSVACSLSYETRLSAMTTAANPCTELRALTGSPDCALPDRKLVDTVQMQEGWQVSSHWFMDFASVLAARVLQVKPGEKVLDLCAAPGGKSLVLAQMLFPEHHYREQVGVIECSTSTLHSNELDRNRNKRLTSNLRAYLPEALYTDKNAVKILQIDGSAKTAAAELPLGEDGYDKVLLDAPCSSERHIIHAYLTAASAGQISEEMANWKASHTKMIAKQQLALLLTALRAVKPGGKVLYATCSISKEENDDVVERMLEAVKRDRKKNNLAWKVQVDAGLEKCAASKDVLDQLSEITKYGRIVLPDHAGGERWGPMYFCLLQKVQSRTRVASEKFDDEEDAPV